MQVVPLSAKLLVASQLEQEVVELQMVHPGI